MVPLTFSGPFAAISELIQLKVEVPKGFKVKRKFFFNKPGAHVWPLRNLP